MNVFKEIHNQLYHTKVHFDDICIEIGKKSDYFPQDPSSIVPVRGPGNDGGGYTQYAGKGKYNNRKRGNEVVYACVDFYNDGNYNGVCRYGGRCGYSHEVGALPSPNYSPYGDPMRQQLQFAAAGGANALVAPAAQGAQADPNAAAAAGAAGGAMPVAAALPMNQAYPFAFAPRAPRGGRFGGRGRSRGRGRGRTY